MSRLGVYDNWAKLVGAVMNREHLQQLALCDSFSSTSSSVATTSRLSLDYATAASSEIDQLTAPSSPRAPRNNASTQANARGVAATIFAVPLAYYRRRMLREYDLFVSNYFSDHFPAHLLDQLDRFSLHELQVGTDSFSKKNMIGRGGFSKVYKCRLADGSLVAMKRLKEEHIQSGDYMYRTEVKMKFNMSAHPNLLQLRGFCLTRKERMLVYPFLANRSVASCLRERPKSQPPLDWATRERIALGTAKGLAYLHEQCGQKIIHRDVKAANILLNVDFEAVVGDFGLVEFMEHGDAHGAKHFEPVICDFGLAKFMDHDDTHATTAVRGTIGHVAPEYLNTGKVTEKTDVFAYGVMLLELVSGQKAFGLARLANDDNLMVLDWVKWLLREKKFKYYLMDVDLKGNCIDEDVEKFIQLSLLCTWGNPNKRPKMSDVVQMLQGRDGLAERWYEYLQEQELLPQESNYGPYHHNTEGSDCTLPLEMEVVNSISSLGDNHYECLNGKTLPRSNLKFYRFSYLKKATKNFKSDMVLGEGSYGSVYKGWVDENSLMPSEFGSGILVAIKKLNPQSIRGFKEWQSEVNILGRLWNPNLVKLLGYCWEDKELLLVYEFMQKGSRGNHLFRRNASTESLSWDVRLKVAIGAARGLTFLHTSETQIIHRNFRASNILLDENYNAKLSGFGLARIRPSMGESHVTTQVIGTYGYAAPEYVATRHLYVKSDVYGFGVVLLEIMTGLRAFDMSRPGRQDLVEWVKPLLRSECKLDTIMDPRIEGQYSSKAVVLAAQLTLKCLELDPNNRPSMKEVGEVLEQIATFEKRRESRSSISVHPSSPHQHWQSPRYAR